MTAATSASRATAERGGPFGRWRQAARAPIRAAAAPSVPAESSPLGGRRGGKLVAPVAAACFAAGLWSFGSGAYIVAKAHVAQVLLELAWQRTRASGEAVRPWPWADTHTVARLTAPAHGVDLFVLAGASGRTLAFGPGHLDGSAAPGAPGNSVITAHRDTHFAFLARLAAGDELAVEAPDGRRLRYRVARAEIGDHRALRLPRDAAVPTLTLVTCYPFDAFAASEPLRYVVVS